MHRLDAARLYRLALEKAAEQPVYHAVGDSGVPFREIAEVIGRQLRVPAVVVPAEKASEHFGWMAMFVGVDCPASGAKTEQALGWRATQHGLIQDIDRPEYFGQ